ncbi:MAG: type II toxin-antitoxin system mRNA interferase toxin, RelE/StbE family [Candidatus Nitrotoga sp.]|nr:type II toxin-antitoxin system mRNA interferase toxin, RelE/StbE family [Candidatus Nitrotoga sp.]
MIADWTGYRECHVKPDLLLIYHKPDADTLRLALLGSASRRSGALEKVVAITEGENAKDGEVYPEIPG